MDPNALFSLAHGLQSPWEVESLQFSVEDKRLTLPRLRSVIIFVSLLPSIGICRGFSQPWASMRFHHFVIWLGLLGSYKHAAPVDLLHLDTKKLSNFNQMGHPANGIRHWRNKGEGYQMLHVCSDDHSRACYMEVLPDEQKATTSAFLQRAFFHSQAWACRSRSCSPPTAPLSIQGV